MALGHGRERRRLWQRVVGPRTWQYAAAALAGLALLGPAAPAAAAPSGDAGPQRSADGQHGPWRFDATATGLTDVARSIGADRLWRSGGTGRGVGVALVDTGVAPVEGLRSVAHGPDLSFDGPRHLDSYGHGTHLAGIIAGSGADFRGLAPGAALTSVRVGGLTGATDVAQVIAAIDWVVAHRNDDPANPIRVLNLAYGTDGLQDPQIDPLTHAVENAWRAGIVVVAAGGNAGDAPLADPARDPFVVAVGAADTRGTVGSQDDTLTDFSSRGDATRRVDLVAPGRSIVSLRDPGGVLDSAFPGARVGDRLFKGSGTSQAAAVVSGAVALLLERHPGLTPDEVKAALIRGAQRLPFAPADAAGAGEIDVARSDALAASVSGATQSWPRSSGTGSLEAARGSVHVAFGGATLTGENDAFGPFDTAAWARASTAGTAWRGDAWIGRALNGNGWGPASGDESWSGVTWSGVTWSGVTWSGVTWSGVTWSGVTWSGVTWSGVTWSGVTWSGVTWSGVTWSGVTWSGVTWSGVTWSGVTWSGGSWS